MSEVIFRSYLFVPATRTDRIAKARAAHPDAVIVDLEDAVPLAEKEAAREALVRDVGHDTDVLVRVNGAETEWFQADLAACATIGARGVLVPKAEDPDALCCAADRLPAEVPILPLIETARGYSARDALSAAPRVQRLVFGSIDFQLDVGIHGEHEELLYFRSGLVLASRMAGIQPPVDGVTVQIDDIEVVRADAIRAKRLGFGAKLCIHPKQVPAVNDCFRPTADEVAWATRIVDATEATNGGAVTVDGKMVDRPVIIKAERILREARDTRGH
jgi:citrate lyase subunit beta/citryl-CoA lyase